jgi:hypothetical protein
MAREEGVPELHRPSEEAGPESNTEDVAG